VPFTGRVCGSPAQTYGVVGRGAFSVGPNDCWAQGRAPRDGTKKKKILAPNAVPRPSTPTNLVLAGQTNNWAGGNPRRKPRKKPAGRGGATGRPTLACRAPTRRGFLDRPRSLKIPPIATAGEKHVCRIKERGLSFPPPESWARGSRAPKGGINSPWDGPHPRQPGAGQAVNTKGR